MGSDTGVQASELSTTSPNESSPGVFLEELVLHRRILSGDESAALECLDRYGSVVYCGLLHLTGDVGLSEDLTEQVFVELWCSPRSFDPRCGPLALQLLGSASSALRRGDAADEHLHPLQR